LAVVRIDYKVNDKELEDSNKELKKSIKGNDLLQKELAQTNEKYKDQDKQIGKTNTALSGLGGQLTAIGNRFQIAGKGAGDMAASMLTMSNASGGATKSLKLLRLAIIGTGIGLLVVGIAAVAAAFKSSEAGQNKYAKLLAVIGVVVGNLSDILANVGEKIISVFEDPQQAVIDFSEIVKTNIVNRFNGLLELIPQLSKAVTQLFEGDFAGSAKTAGDAVAKATLGVEDFTDKAKDGFESATEAVKEFNAQTEKEIGLATELADIRAKTDRLERKFWVDTAQFESKIADLRLKGKQEQKFTAKERLAFLNEANDLQNKLIVTELTIARNRAEEATISNTFSKSTKENLDEEAKLKAAVFAIDAKRLRQQKRIQTEINTTFKQAQTEAKQGAKQTDEDIDLIDRKTKATQELAEIEEEKRIADIEKKDGELAAELERRRVLLEDEALIEEERALIIAESEQKVTDIKVKSANAETDAKKKSQQEQRKFISDTFGDTKAGAIFEATLSTRDATIAAFKAVVGIPVVGPALAPIAAAAAAAFGTRNIAKIAGTSPPKFAKGGEIGGNLHANGGTLIEAERGEFVMSRGAVNKYGSGVMDKINSLELNDSIFAGSQSASTVIVNDNKELVRAFKNRPSNSINIDSQGYHAYQQKQNALSISKANRYSV
jgi:hypothetical protein